MTGEVVWALDVDADLETVDALLVGPGSRGLLGDGDVLEDGDLLGISEEQGRATVWLARRRDDLPLSGRWREVPVDGWHERWRASVTPVRLGRFVVTPPWRATPGPGGADQADEVVVEPAQAFGTGHHETTARCAAALESLDLAGRSVLDVGTGSGILAVIAVRLGASPVLGCDVDPVAVAAARQTAAVNGADVEVIEGSLDALGDLVADVVVANLDTATVVRLAPDLVAHCRDRLVVSGVSNERSAEAVTALAAGGARNVVASPGREWALVTAQVGASGVRP